PPGEGGPPKADRVRVFPSRLSTEPAMKSPSLRLALLLSVFAFACQANVSAAEVGVRVRFGLTDKEPENWNGTVNVTPGKVAAVSGWRFEQTDHANGTEGWVASTRAAADNRTAAQKAKAKA